MAAYFVVAIAVAFDHGHYLSIPFLGLFLAGFGYVGWVSLWQGGVGLAIRGFFASLVRRQASSTVVVPPPAFAVINAKPASDLPFAAEAEPLVATSARSTSLS
jgi:hypothetical protein